MNLKYLATTIRRRSNFLLAFGLPALATWLYTWGIAIDTAASYYPEGIAEAGGITFIFKVDTHEKHFGIPFLFVWSSDTRPYDVTISAQAPELALRNIHVRTVDIQYSDWNHFVTVASDSAQSFQPKVLTDRKTDPITQMPTFPDLSVNTAILPFPKLITERQSVRLKFDCFVFSQDGSYSEIKFEKYLELRSRRKIYSFRELVGLGSV